MNFRAFLEEGRVFRNKIADYKNHAYLNHEVRIGNNHLHLQIVRDADSYQPDHHRVDFWVNNRLSRAKAKPDKDGFAVLHHVSDKVDHFIRHAKPRALRFTAGDGDDATMRMKHQVYQRFAQHVAKKHGGKYYFDEPNFTHVVKFE